MTSLPNHLPSALANPAYQNLPDTISIDPPHNYIAADSGTDSGLLGLNQVQPDPLDTPIPIVFIEEGFDTESCITLSPDHPEYDNETPPGEQDDNPNALAHHDYVEIEIDLHPDLDTTPVKNMHTQAIRLAMARNSFQIDKITIRKFKAKKKLINGSWSNELHATLLKTITIYHARYNALPDKQRIESIKSLPQVTETTRVLSYELNHIDTP